MKSLPISSLANLARAWASPEMDRPVLWRTLIGRDSWALLLITKGKPGDPPPRPGVGPVVRLSPDWVRRTGGDLTAAQLIHERARQYLRHHTQQETEVDVEHAASIATDAAISALAEFGVDVEALTRPAPPVQEPSNPAPSPLAGPTRTETRNGD